MPLPLKKPLPDPVLRFLEGLRPAWEGERGIAKAVVVLLIKKQKLKKPTKSRLNSLGIVLITLFALQSLISDSIQLIGVVND